MSYNGIGLASAKGSATSGHIQKNQANNTYSTPPDTGKKYNFRHGQHVSRLENEKNKSKKKDRKLDSRLVRYMEKRAFELRVAQRRMELEQRYFQDEEVDEEKEKQLENEISQLRGSLAQMAASQPRELFRYGEVFASDSATAEQEADDMLKQLMY